MLASEHFQTVFKYDVMDRLIEQINFDGRAQRYQYDAGGQLIESEDAGQQSAYEYDKAGRLIKRQSNQSDGSQYQERYEYDNEGQLIRVQSGTVSTDKTATEGHNATRVEFKRDRLGRVTQETQSMVNAAGATLWRHQVKHQYDVLGNEAGTGLHNLPLLNWQTYGSGHLHGITLDNETLIDFERDKLHREVERSFAGTKVLRKYDRLWRLLGVRGISQNTRWDEDIRKTINRDLHYDAVGQLTQIDTLKGQHQYRYDAARRLVAASQPGLQTTQYRFDPAGNRLFADPIQETLSAEEERARWEELAHKNWDNPDFNLLQPALQPQTLKAPDCWPDNRIEHDEHWRYSHDRFGNLTEKRGIQKVVERSLHGADDRIHGKSAN